jgi:DNA-directed RNA polymerase specialized sigma24 family protein
MIYRYARRAGLHDADAADISQEVLSEVARCIQSFEYRPKRGRFRDWLRTLVRRRVAGFLRKKGREASDPAADDATESEPCPADESSQESVRQALRLAPTMAYDVFIDPDLEFLRHRGLLEAVAREWGRSTAVSDAKG